MAGETTENPIGTCFVVMGFGKKTDFETGRVLDLDKSYKNMIKPAVEEAGLKCIRADEIVHSGLIDVPMYEQLLKADVVVADLSTSNKNAFYELGVRHALRPYTTVVIAEDGIKTFPFDISHVAVRQYHHLGEDIGFEEVMRFREQLTNAIKEIIKVNPRNSDSPVYTFLNGLTPPALAAVVQAKVQESIDSNSQNKKETAESGKLNVDEKNSSTSASPGDAGTHSVLMLQIDEAQKNGDWLTAKTLLSLVRKMIQEEMKRKQETAQVKMVEQQENPYLLQRLALVTYKSKLPDEEAALMEAHQLLNILNPGTSNDTETLGLWGAVHKRLWELKKDILFLDEAVRAYERGFYIKNDYYNGINYAFLLNVRAEQASDLAEAIADFAGARRIRKEVLVVCERWLKDNPMPAKENIPPDALTAYLKNWYWVKATIGEAYAGLDDENNAQLTFNEANENAPEDWMKQSSAEQLSKLRPLLENSPLMYIKTGAKEGDK
jgi:tetratricopeptide (TPR) repeat protein